jgi:hypothetical protein
MSTEKIVADIIEEVLNFYDISGKELFFISDSPLDKELLRIKKVAATLLKEIGKTPIKEISNLFGESVIDTRRKYLQGIDRRTLSDIEKLSRIIRKRNAVQTTIRRRSEKYK